MSDLVRNPEDRLSHNEAHIIHCFNSCGLDDLVTYDAQSMLSEFTSITMLPVVHYGKERLTPNYNFVFLKSDSYLGGLSFFCEIGGYLYLQG